jgi:hypothetical protein
MESEKGADPTKAALRDKKRLITAGLIACVAVLLCLSAFALYSASVSQKAVVALQAQIDLLLSASAATNQAAQDARDAEIAALQARIDELRLSQADRDDEILALQARIDELLRLSAQSDESLKDRAADIASLQARVDELTKEMQSASAYLADAAVPLASLPDKEMPLAQIPGLMPEEETVQAAATAQAGQTITVAVFAPEIKDMYGYELKVYFDADDIQYGGSLKSGVSAIPTIFHKEFDNYVLIGATMIGQKDGFTAEAGMTQVCSFTMTAVKDCDLSELSISGVNIVNGNLDCTENIGNWEIITAVEAA